MKNMNMKERIPFMMATHLLLYFPMRSVHFKCLAP